MVVLLLWVTASRKEYVRGEEVVVLDVFLA